MQKIRNQELIFASAPNQYCTSKYESLIHDSHYELSEIGIVNGTSGMFQLYTRDNSWIRW